MIKTQICKGDKVVIIRGEGKLQEEKGQRKVCTVLKVDRIKGRVWLEMARPKARRGEREEPVRGVEVWKTVRYDQKSGEAGGLKIVRRPIHVSNVKLVEKGPRREFAR